MIKFTTFLTFILVISLAFVFSGQKGEISKEDPGVQQVLMGKIPGTFNPDEYINRQREMYNWLMSEAVALTPESIITINVTDEEMAEVENFNCASCGKIGATAQKMRVGIVKPTGYAVEFSGDKLERLQAVPGGGFVWTAAIESKNASGLRVRFSNVVLPDNAALYIYTTNGEAFGPYKAESNDFWSNTVGGPLAYVQLRFTAPVSPQDLQGAHFSIQEVGHLGDKFLLPFLQKTPEEIAETSNPESLCSGNASCIDDASCYTTTDWAQITNVKSAIAHMEWVSGMYIYYCTGGLLNDNVSTSTIPYFLTANHCISTQTDATNLECYWQYWTASCHGACYDPVGAVPRTIGATLLSTSTTCDYTFMQLSQTPPAGSTLLGWTTTAVSGTNGYQLYRISHPAGSPAAFSRHQVDTSSPTCSGLPRGNWIYSEDILNGTEGGSSGSPVCNASGQVVGQLTGCCGYNCDDACDVSNNWTVDGAFANYYSNISTWLNPSTTTGTQTHVHSIVLSRSGSLIRTYTATVTIRDENGNPVSGATVTGTFSGSVTGSGSATTNASGVAAIKKTKWFGGTSFGFCVTNVTHATMTYNSSANVETCDSM